MPARIHSGRTVRVVLSDTVTFNEDPAPIAKGTTITVAVETTQGPPNSAGTLVQDPYYPGIAFLTAGDPGSRGKVVWTITEPGDPPEVVESEVFVVLNSERRKGRWRSVFHSYH